MDSVAIAVDAPTRKRVDEFKNEIPSLEEIQSFYGLEGECSATGGERPYTWSNTVASLDGVVNDGSGMSGVASVSLKNIPSAKAGTDFHLLNAGWAYADAILFSAASLRSERNQKLLIRSKELIAFRTDILKKSTEQPDVVIVTSSGWIDISLPIWSAGGENRRKLIVTSTSGMQNLIASIVSQMTETGKDVLSSHADEDCPPLKLDIMDVREWLDEHNVRIKSFSAGTPTANDIDLVEMSRFLKKELHIDHVDVSAGPTLISLMIKAKLMDEYRYTSSGVVLGRYKEDSDDRPTISRMKAETFPSEINQYKKGESPLLEIMAVRLYGPFHVYHRGKWIYKH